VAATGSSAPLQGVFQRQLLFAAFQEQLPRSGTQSGKPKGLDLPGKLHLSAVRSGKRQAKPEELTPHPHFHFSGQHPNQNLDFTFGKPKTPDHGTHRDRKR
jgi:hypothetical protein